MAGCFPAEFLVDVISEELVDGCNRVVAALYEGLKHMDDLALSFCVLAGDFFIGQSRNESSSIGSGGGSCYRSRDKFHPSLFTSIFFRLNEFLP